MRATILAWILCKFVIEPTPALKIASRGAVVPSIVSGDKSLPVVYSRHRRHGITR